MFSRVLLGFALLALAACGQNKEPVETPAPQPAPERAASGLDLGSIDERVRPADDFFRYANGGWLDRTALPDDHSSYGGYAALIERRDAQLRALLEKGALAPPGSEARKAGDHFATYLDVSAIDAKGLAPIAEDLAFVRNLESPSALMTAFGRKDLAAATPFEVTIDIDVKTPGAYAVYLGQSGLGLADREAYLDPKFAERRSRYKAYIAEMLSLAGENAALARAEAVYALEEKIAEAHWEASKRRMRELSYNPRSRASLDEFAPADWNAFFAAAQLPQRQELVLREDDAIQRLARLVAAEPVQGWRDYLIFHLLHANADILPQKFDAARSAFLGAPPKERVRRAVANTDREFGDALGGLYADEHFDKQTRQQSLTLVQNLRAALEEKIVDAPWMADTTKDQAREKIEGLDLRIGRPQAPRDGAGPEVVRGDAYGNRKRARDFEWRLAIAHLDGAVDQTAWIVAPHDADIVYDPASNTLTAPAAMWQPPYFDPQGDAAVNYGAIGALIGHELTHAVDDGGRRSDSGGLLRDWWTGEDAAAFKKRAEALAAQYASFAKAAGLEIDPDRVTAEAAADLGGLSIAHRAYQLSLKGAAAPIVDGLTGDQRFFISWAQMWRRKTRDERLRAEIAAGPLPIAEFRVNGILRNFDAWHAAFQVKQGDMLYLPPAERVQLWRQ
jgi:predicted metalloendopeptidase